MTRRAISFSENNGDNNKQPAKQDVVMEAQRSKQSTNESIRKKKKEKIKKEKKKTHCYLSFAFTRQSRTSTHRLKVLFYSLRHGDTIAKKKKEINQLVR